MKVLRIVSDLTEVPLLEVRTDGNKIEVIVDNSNGKISKEIGDTLQSLQDYIKHSSHLRLEEPEAPAAHLLRYVLENGDVAEVTTDGATCLINGKLLSSKEKAAFFDALVVGKIKVAHKADLHSPIPIPAGVKRKHPETERKLKIDINEMRKTREKIISEKEKEKKDEFMGNADFKNATFEIPSDDIQFARNLAQGLARGNSDAD